MSLFKNWKLAASGVIFAGATVLSLSANGETPVRDDAPPSHKSPVCDEAPLDCRWDGVCDSAMNPDLGLASCSDQWRFSGWLQAGILANADSPGSGFNGPYNQVDDRRGQLNQLYMIAEKSVSESAYTTLGGRLDVLWGADYFLAQSTGLERRPNGAPRWNSEDYGLALPQAYAELGNRDWSVKAGHFYTPIGFEGVPSVGNFFYSKSLSYMFAGPFTHWGAIATHRYGLLTIDAGLVNGWDTFDRTNDSVSFIGKISLGEPSSRNKASFGIITGDETNGAGTAQTNRTRYSLILSSLLTDDLEYVFHHWLGTQDAFLANGEAADWYGIDQYLFYNLSSNVKLGLRYEWFRDDEGVRLGLNRPSNPNNPPFVGSMHSVSTGINYRINNSLIVRPELRYDSFHGTGNPFNDGLDDSQFLYGFDAILTF